MQAVILAGGFGTRLRPHTEKIPKPMMEVLGKPFLEYQLAYARSQDVTDVVLCVGYLHEHIKDYFGNGKEFGLNIEYAIEDEPRGTGPALVLAKPKVKGDFLFMFGDTYLPISYSELARLVTGNAIGAVTAYTNPRGTMRNNLRVKGSIVEAYDKTSAEGMTHVEAGVSFFRKKVLDLIEEADVSFESAVFPRLIAKGELRAFVSSERFYDIGTPELLEYFRAHAKGLRL